MSNKTELNPVSQGNGTVINPITADNASDKNLSDNQNKTELNPVSQGLSVKPQTTSNPCITEINPELTSDHRTLSPGTVIAGRYEIREPLSLSTGEADIYIVVCDGVEYAAKIYRRHQAIKPEIITALKSIDSPYIAKLYDAGEIDGLPFEIIPYYKNGSLQGTTLTLEELRQKVIPHINEALHVLHQNDIIHKDLKPSNIMWSDDKQSVALIDFGISSVTPDGNTVVLTSTGMTPEYSAPETFRSLFLEESDYYSFGITLYELFCGYTPYKNMSAEEIARFTAVQRIPFPETMPRKLRELICAVTYFDITGRNDKNNPNRRWTYDEVNAWCDGKDLVLPGEGVAPINEMPPYEFEKHTYTSISSLVAALASDWSNGKKQLYRGLLSAYFKQFSPEHARYCTEAEEEATHSVGKDDVIFWKLLYRLAPDFGAFYYCGHTYESLPALGRDMLEKLWRDSKSDHSFWESILTQKLLSSYLSLTSSTNETLINAVNALEAVHNRPERSKRDRLLDYYTAAYLLSGQKLLAIGEKRIKSVNELRAYMQGLLDESYKTLEKFCHGLVSYDGTLDVQLEAWLCAIGRHDELEIWRKGILN